MLPKLDLLLDQFIEADIRAWIESKHKDKEAEQLELIDEL